MEIEYQNSIVVIRPKADSPYGMRVTIARPRKYGTRDDGRWLPSEIISCGITEKDTQSIRDYAKCMIEAAKIADELNEGIETS